MACFYILVFGALGFIGCCGSRSFQFRFQFFALFGGGVVREEPFESLCFGDPTTTTTIMGPVVSLFSRSQIVGIGFFVMVTFVGTTTFRSRCPLYPRSRTLLVVFHGLKSEEVFSSCSDESARRYCMYRRP